MTAPRVFLRSGRVLYRHKLQVVYFVIIALLLLGYFFPPKPQVSSKVVLTRDSSRALAGSVLEQRRLYPNLFVPQLSGVHAPSGGDGLQHLRVPKQLTSYAAASGLDSEAQGVRPFSPSGDLQFLEQEVKGQQTTDRIVQPVLVEWFRASFWNRQRARTELEGDVLGDGTLCPHRLIQSSSGLDFLLYSAPDSLTYRPTLSQVDWMCRRRNEQWSTLGVPLVGSVLGIHEDLGDEDEQPERSDSELSQSDVWTLFHMPSNEAIDAETESESDTDTETGDGDPGPAGEESEADSNALPTESLTFKSCNPLLGFFQPFWIRVTSAGTTESWKSTAFRNKDRLLEVREAEDDEESTTSSSSSSVSLPDLSNESELVCGSSDSAISSVFPSKAWIDGNGRFGLDRQIWNVPSDCNWSKGPDTSFWWLRLHDRLTRQVIDYGISLVQTASGDYYHFLLESLPRLMLIPRELWWNNPASPYKLIMQVPSYPTSQQPFMDWLGITPDRVVFLAGRRSTLLVRRELIIPQPCECFGCNPLVLQEWRRFLYQQTWLSKEIPLWNKPRTGYLHLSSNLPHSALEQDRPSRLRKLWQRSSSDAHQPAALPESVVDRQSLDDEFVIVWIQRKGSRELINEERLFEIAIEVFPEATLEVAPSNLGAEEVARLYHRGDVFIGPHGAGFANLFFARPGFHTLEIMPADYDIRMYDWIGRTFGGLSHRFITVPKTSKESKLLVDEVRFRQGLQDIREDILTFHTF